MKNAIVPDDMATPRYHQLEARIAATNESAARSCVPCRMLKNVAKQIMTGRIGALVSG